MSEGDPTGEGELRLAPESIEELARCIAELIATAGSSGERSQHLTAEEVSRWWGVGRRWVYDHAEELGARRLGSGSRPRLRFDPDEVAERLGPPDRDPRGGGDRRRLGAIAGDGGTDSLSTRRRATVGRRHKKAGAGAVNAPPTRRRYERRNSKAKTRGAFALPSLLRHRIGGSW